MSDYPANLQRTAAQWSTINPYLPKGMLAIESDTGRKKYGTGQRYSATPYVLDETAPELPQSASAGDVLTFSGGAWVAAAGAPEWSAIANKPTSFLEYNGENTYNQGEFVSYQGSLWRATDAQVFPYQDPGGALGGWEQFGGGGGYTIHFANTNDDKLYMGEPVSNLSSVTPNPGDYVVVVNEAYRVEQYMGDLYGGTNWNYDINWRIVGPNSVFVYVEGYGANGDFLGTPTPSGATTQIGWMQTGVLYLGNYPSPQNAGYEIGYIEGETFYGNYGTFHVPYAQADISGSFGQGIGHVILPTFLPPRCTITLREYA